MRESRTSGSVEGVMGNHNSYSERYATAVAPRRCHHIACVAAPCICPPDARAGMWSYFSRTLR